jgi:hypothetical protein
MNYKFKSREDLIAMFNSIPTPHSHIIKLHGNCANIEWDGDAPEGWSEYEAKQKKSKKDG